MSAHGAASGMVGLDAVAQLPRPHPLLATPRRVLRMRSDAALAERFRAGDQEAFSVLYERHRAVVLAVCMGVLGSRHDAEDAAQDSFAALAVALRTSPPRDMRAWLARVSRNAAIDVIRRRRIVTPADENLEGPAPASTEVRAELESVLDGLRELPESQRTALLMRELGGHSYQEIGELLELDESAVRGLIARGRVGLRTHREAAEMPCAAAREALAAEPDGRQRDRTVRRHLRSCASCKAYGRGLRQDARSLRSFVPSPAGGIAGGGAIFGGFAAKTALTGGVLSQLTAACAVSVCAAGGIALLYPHATGHHRALHTTPAPLRARTPRDPGASTGRATRAEASTALRAAPSRRPTSLAPQRSSAVATRIKLAPAQAAKVISTASVVLTRQFQLPGAQTPSNPSAAAPTTGPAPTSAAALPTHPVYPTSSGLGGSSTGYPSDGWNEPVKTSRGGWGSATATGTGTGEGTATGTPAGDGSAPGTGKSSGIGSGDATSTSGEGTPSGPALRLPLAPAPASGQ